MFFALLGVSFPLLASSCLPLIWHSTKPAWTHHAKMALAGAGRGFGFGCDFAIVEVVEVPALLQDLMMAVMIRVLEVVELVARPPVEASHDEVPTWAD